MFYCLTSKFVFQWSSAQYNQPHFKRKNPDLSCASRACGGRLFQSAAHCTSVFSDALTVNLNNLIEVST